MKTADPERTGTNTTPSTQAITESMMPDHKPATDEVHFVILRANLDALPPTMRRRASLARTIATDDPSRVETDGELLPWVHSEEEGCWLSFDGNYSVVSPAEKRKKAEDAEKRRVEWERTSEQLARDRYVDALYWSKVRQAVLDRDGHSCRLCGASGGGKLHVHHILKRREGGRDTLDNLVTVCPRCHAKADGKLYNPEWSPNGRSANGSPDANDPTNH